MTKIRFGADEYELKATWSASLEFDEKIGDPLQLATAASMRGEQVFTSRTVVRAVWIGLKAGGQKFTESEVGELCQQCGMVNALSVANSYLIDLVRDPSEDLDEDESAEESSKKT